MPEEPAPIIETDDTANTKNRFPIVAQLGILGVFMLVLFGALFIDTNPTPTPANTAAPAISTDPTHDPVIPEEIDEEAVELQAAAAYVWDVQSQRALYSKNANDELPLASITKLMTALLAHELIADDTQAVVSLSAIRQEGSSGLSAGEELDVEDLRELALVSSSNDAAFALAASVGSLLGDRDPAAQFVSGMNIRAAELGLGTLQFWNTTGLDLSDTEPGAIGSARDVSFLMEHIITHYPEIIAPTQESASRIYNTTGAYHEVRNTNQIAREIPNMIGSKTGYTDLAGGNLTIAFDAGHNRPIIITVLGSTRDDRFTDVLTLVAAAQQAVGG